MGKRSRSKPVRPAAPTPATSGGPRPQAPAAGEPARPLAPGTVARPWLLLVVAVAVAVYLNGIPGQFVFDDKLIQRDPRINGQTSFWTIFVTDYWHTYIGTSHDLYRPLTIASYALNRMLTGLHPEAFHAVNIVLHAAAAVLVVLLVEALLADGVLALAAGLLFAAHPVHTEAVTGIVGRAEVLSALFLLLALWVQARDYRVLGRGPRVGLPLALLAYFCALGAKETAIVGPGLVAVVDYLQHQRREERWDWRRTLRLTVLYAGVATAFVALRYGVVGLFLQRAPQKEGHVLFGQPLTMRLFTACEIFAIYARLLLFPHTLSADYSYRQVPLLDAPDAIALMGFLAAVGVAAAGMWALRRRVWPVAFAVGFFAVAYSIAANFPIPLQVLVAERLMYLPSVGFCVGLGWVLVALGRWVGARTAGGRLLTAAAVAVVVVLYGARTMVRNLDWRGPETIYAATVRASPECFGAHFNYSAVLLEEDKNELALEHLQKAYAIRRDHYPMLVNLANAYLRVGKPDMARDIAREGLTLRPNDRRLKNVLTAAEDNLRVPPPGQ